MPEITVIIPNYNGINFIKDCLDSVLEQVEGTPEYEILVVDNGSTDGSMELIQSQFQKVRMEPLSENTGFCHAVNVGIMKSQSKYVVLLNNDTRVKKSFLLELYTEIEKKPLALLTAPNRSEVPLASATAAMALEPKPAPNRSPTFSTTYLMQ